MIEIKIEEYKERIPTVIVVDDGNNYDPMSRYNGQIKIAKRWIGKNIIGQALSDFLNTSPIDYERLSLGTENNIQGEGEGEGEGEGAEPSVQEKVDILIELYKDVLIFKSYIPLIPYLNVSDTGSGFAIASNDQFAPASKERTDALTKIINEQLNDALDDMFDFLEQNEEFHHMWKISPAYTIMTNTFIPTYYEFVRTVTFEGSRFDFIKLKPEMYNAIYLHIRSYISLQYVEYLLQAFRENDLTEHDLIIFAELKLAYANFVMGKKEIAEAHMMRVQTTMIDNIANYPLYSQSKEYNQFVQNQIPPAETPIFKMIM